MISSDLFLCLLWLNFQHWITWEFSRFRCKPGTVYVLDNIFNFLTDWHFSIFSPKAGKHEREKTYLDTFRAASFPLWWHLSFKFRVDIQFQETLTLFTLCTILYFKLGQGTGREGWERLFYGPSAKKTDLALKLLFCLVWSLCLFLKLMQKCRDVTNSWLDDKLPLEGLWLFKKCAFILPFEIYN